MKRRTAAEIRELFLTFFESKAHRRVSSSPLVPQNDPTLMFTNAGMVQFKDVFTGREKRDYTRACSSQKCVRAGGKHNDLENVGFTARHHTFFEMLGNFSFGDYFKKDAIAFAWELVTGPDWLGIDPDRLVVTVFEGEDNIPGDDEAAQLWLEQGVRPERLFRLGRKDNFWQMGDTGPCGPCSEIHIYRGEETDRAFIDDHGRKFFIENSIPDQDAWMELWNLVFMQFDMAKDGSLSPLPQPSIDTGAGLERLAAVLQGVQSNYDTDLMRDIIAKVEQLSGKKYGSSMQPDDVAMRVIADHSRATAFLIADGVLPTNEGRGYVLRRIMRRAIRYGSRLGLNDPFLFQTVARVIELMQAAYPELEASRATITEFARNEELGFRRTLDKGMRMLSETMIELGNKGEKAIPFETIFFMHDTHGFPPDLTRIVANENDFSVDEEGYRKWLEERRAGGGEFGGSGEKAVADVYHQLHGELGDSEFLGYDSLEGEAKVLALVQGGKKIEKAGKGAEVEVVYDRTPFYGESGGQTGDAGRIESQGAVVEVTDTLKPVGGLVVHRGKVLEGTLESGKPAKLAVDAERRQAIRGNHSATHLLHHVLREVLGDHVKQAGSKVGPEGFRFDYTHFSALTAEQIAEIEERVNALVRANLTRDLKVVSIEEARAAGATMLFGEKYGAQVRMVRFGPSLELCGGTHVDRTGDIGAFVIASDESLAAGVRRIFAVTGREAIRRIQEQRRALRSVADRLRTSAEAVEPALEKLQGNLKALEKELDRIKKQGSTAGAGDLAEKARDVNGIKVVTARIDPADVDAFRGLADKLRDKLKTALVAFGGEKDGKAVLLVAATPDVVAKGLKAGDVVREIAKEVGGRGGGKPDMAQAGGPDPSKIEQALEKVYELAAR
ncbi:MAG TPA: alanine--tRNA ligase [Myxococcales bacterium]|nr:alanine--tRNA ligase [Myxococcales bacterium]